MSRRPQTCKKFDCNEVRSIYSQHGFCEKHDIEADLEEQERYDASPRAAALKALDEADTIEELKDFIREYIVETMIDG